MCTSYWSVYVAEAEDWLERDYDLMDALDVDSESFYYRSRPEATYESARAEACAHALELATRPDVDETRVVCCHIYYCGGEEPDMPLTVEQLIAFAFEEASDG